MQLSPTTVKFCHNTWSLSAQVQLVKHEEGKTYLIANQTPFHPVSHIWPDHPADRGEVIVDGHTYSVVDCLVGAVELATQDLHVDKAIPVKRDEFGWAFVVVHVLEQELTPVIGANVEFNVDKNYQQALSRGHSAGHLAYLALNKVLVEGGYWRKKADRKDPHGNYDFNSYAQETSFVTEDQCIDLYRLGKTLRKRGLNRADMLTDLPDIMLQVNQQLESWLAGGADVAMECQGEALTNSRYWHCDLGEEAPAVIPCGGTHVQSLQEYAEINVQLTAVDSQNVEMLTRVKAA
ncbi:alanyl-tRNA editing protein [Vibrio astriarenae]|uniref:Alanyl-tRNA editing protein n=1 Tax=Vibrio astriarenae TaxID=1481923 RepID=A0A7Z2YCY8_9VIBR|nr:alanyl-tRNA editing protein [Vibrio astriarenae]QIA62584.1 alanyl-tRNA editing protein [Vibrio astriarenae]